MRKTLLIGGNSGIGAAFAEFVPAQGNLLFRPTVDEFNVEDRSQMFKYMDDLGSVDRIVYCAGVNYLDWIGDIKPNQADEIMSVNVLGFITVLDLHVSMWGREHPVNVLAVSSDAAVRPLRTSIAYCASKAALNAAVKVAARELAPHGWRVNAVAPGVTDGTHMTEYVDKRVSEIRGWSAEHARAYETSQCPMGRRAEPREIASVMDSVLSGPSYLNGEIIAVNGGR